MASWMVGRRVGEVVMELSACSQYRYLRDQVLMHFQGISMHEHVNVDCKQYC